jgi:hypothetical protein
MRERQQIQHNESQTLASQTQAMLNLNRKLQTSSVKGQVKAIDLELRKLESTQAMLQCSIMKVSTATSHSQLLSIKVVEAADILSHSPTSYLPTSKEIMTLSSLSCFSLVWQPRRILCPR